jgi:undecaprenyl-diphosphatase
MNLVDATLEGLTCVPCDERLFVVRALGFLADAELLKGGLVVAVLCALWMTTRAPAAAREQRSRVVMTLAAGFAALFVSRVLALVLPFRARPFDFAGGSPAFAPRALESWSAFPSDHAALFFALAVGILVMSRRLGVLALGHAVLVVSLPRIYLGLHHPTDMLAGAAIGATCALVATRPALCRRCAPPVLAWSEGRHAPCFGALAFLLLFETATLFDSVRNGAKLLWPVVKPLLHGAPFLETTAVLGGLAVVAALAWLVRAYRVGAVRRPSSGLP